MFIEKIVNFFDYYHQRRIIKYIKKFKINFFIDVGSHKGEFLSYLLKLHYKKIFCFEPQKEIFRKLYNRYKNSKNIKFYNIALSNNNSKKTFYINKLTLTSTFSKSKKTLFSIIKNLLINSKKPYVKKILIKTKTLDEIFNDSKLNNIFLKVDVEGYELSVLKGARILISKKIKFILIEKQFFQLYEKNNQNKVDHLLKSNNFKLIKKFTYPLLHFQDNLYIKKEKK